MTTSNGICAERRPPPLLSRSVLAALAMGTAAVLSSCGPAQLSPSQGSSTAGAAPPAGAGQLRSCTRTQWSLTQGGTPAGDGPAFFIPFRARYLSGPRCRLSATVTGQLLTGGSTPIRHASAQGTIRAVLGPAGPQAQSPLFAFLWSNWCAPPGSVTARIETTGQAITIAIHGHPMCVNRQQPVSLTWHRM